MAALGGRRWAAAILMRCLVIALIALIVLSGSAHAVPAQEEAQAGDLHLEIEAVFASSCPCPELPERHPDNFRRFTAGQTQDVPLRVSNIGTATATTFTITYLPPSGWELADPEWTAAGDGAVTRTFADLNIEPGGTFGVSVRMYLPPTVSTGYTNDIQWIGWPGSPPPSPTTDGREIWVGPDAASGNWIRWDVAEALTNGGLVHSDANVQAILGGVGLDKGFDGASIGSHRFAAVAAPPHTVWDISCGPLRNTAGLPINDGSAYDNGFLTVDQDVMCLIEVGIGQPPVVTTTTQPRRPDSTTSNTVDDEPIGTGSGDPDNGLGGDGANADEGGPADRTSETGDTALLSEEDTVETIEDAEGTGGGDRDEGDLIAQAGTTDEASTYVETEAAAIRREWAERARVRAPRSTTVIDEAIGSGPGEQAQVSRITRTDGPRQLQLPGIMFGLFGALFGLITISYTFASRPKRQRLAGR